MSPRSHVARRPSVGRSVGSVDRVTNAEHAGDRRPGTPPGPPRVNGSPRRHDGSGPGASDDAFWRRPSGDSPSLVPPPAAAPPDEPEYQGPPHGAPAPATWSPPVIVPVTPPRDMPGQDHARIDAEERGARTMSQGIGLVAGAVVVILIFVLCARVI